MGMKKVKRSHEVFARYHNEYGIQKKFFASKLGIPQMEYYQMVLGMRKIPFSLWDKIIEVSDGNISLSDLLYVAYGDNECISFTSNGPRECTINLKKPIKAVVKEKNSCCDLGVGVEDSPCCMA